MTLSSGLGLKPSGPTLSLSNNKAPINFSTVATAKSLQEYLDELKTAVLTSLDKVFSVDFPRFLVLS